MDDVKVRLCPQVPLETIMNPLSACKVYMILAVLQALMHLYTNTGTFMMIAGRRTPIGSWMPSSCYDFGKTTVTGQESLHPITQRMAPHKEQKQQQ